jgi:hypothetical protein
MVKLNPVLERVASLKVFRRGMIVIQGMAGYEREEKHF